MSTRAVVGLILLMASVTMVALVLGLYHELTGGWILPTSLQNEDLNVIARSMSAIAALFTATIAVCAAGVGLLQLDRVRRSSELSTTLQILERYIEDRHLFAVRDFIHKHMEEVNNTWVARIMTDVGIEAGKKPSCDQRRLLTHRSKEIEKMVKGLSKREQYEEYKLRDLYLVINTLNHTALLIKKDSIFGDVARDLEKLLRGIYPKVEQLITYERARRGERPEEPVYAKHLVRLCWNDQAARPAAFTFSKRVRSLP